MSTSLKQIEEQALALSAEERAKLAECLLKSLRSPLPDNKKTWAEKMEQHIAAFDRGEFSEYPAEDVFADVRRLSR